MIDFVNDSKHLRVADKMINSKYYNYILSPIDKELLTLLWNKVLVQDSPYYKNGLLVTNIKQSTLAYISGLSMSAIKKSINKLDKLGIIITIRHSQNNNRYIIGFRSKGNEWLLFIYHLMNKYGEIVDELIETGNISDLKRVDNFKMSKILKDHIKNNFTNSKLFTDVVANEKNIMELLFNRSDIHKGAVLKVVGRNDN